MIMIMMMMMMMMMMIIIIISKGLDIHMQVKINDETEQRFGVVIKPLSSSK